MRSASPKSTEKSPCPDVFGRRDSAEEDYSSTPVTAFCDSSLGDEIRARLACIDLKLDALGLRLPAGPGPRASGADEVESVGAEEDSQTLLQPFVLPPEPVQEVEAELVDAAQRKLSDSSKATLRAATFAAKPTMKTKTNGTFYIEQDAFRPVGALRPQLNGWTTVKQEKSAFQRAGDSLNEVRSVVSFAAWRAGMMHAASTAQPSGLQRCVHSLSFEVFSCLVILFHAVFLGFSASVDYKFRVQQRPPYRWLHSVEVVFVCLFGAELALRILADRLLFFIGAAWTWNTLDFILVVFSVSDIAIHGSDMAPAAAVGVGRLLRLTRFIRLCRITRVMKHFSSLRVVLFAILGSCGQLFWCFVLIGFIIYMFAVMFLYGAAEYLRALGPDGEDEISTMLKLWYLDVNDVMNVLFMTITGGVDWVDVQDHWRSIGTGYGLLFFVYIFFLQFGVLNVVMATFVNSTTAIAAQDKDTIVKTEIVRMEEYMKRVMQFFKEADHDGSGTLSWEEFEAHISSTRVRAYFQALELDASQAHLLFEMLDVNGNDSVSIDEFVDGCVRLRGGARSVDLNIVLLQSKKLTEQIHVLLRKSRKQIVQVDELLDVVRLTAGHANKSGG